MKQFILITDKTVYRVPARDELTVRAAANEVGLTVLSVEQVKD